MNVWKWVGLAGVVGATAVGIAAGTATVQRRRREFVDVPHDEVRDRLHARFREAKERAAS